MIRNPFKFLDAYTKEDNDIFFGRSQETEEIYTQVFYSDLLLVYGASGTGKTSLLQCGLANKFDDTDWLPINIRREQNVLEALHNELNRTAVTDIKSKTSLPEKVKSIYLDYFKPIYLIFDQFEEVLIFGDVDEQRKLAEEISALRNSDIEVKIILVIREEYLAGLATLEKTLPDLFDNRIRIEKISRAQATEVIERPCAVCGVEIEEGVSSIVLDKLTKDDGSIELTWLQVLMDRLIKTAAEANPNKPYLTGNDPVLSAKIGDVLADFLEEQLSLMTDPEAGERVLKTMISMQGTRKTVTLDDVINTIASMGHKMQPDKVQNILQHFISVRIIREKDEGSTYELRHDGLADKIFGRITAIEKDLLEIRQTLENRYQEYKNRGTLLDASTLEFIAPYESRLYLKGDVEKFVKESKREIEKQKRRIRRIKLTAFALAFTCLLFFTIWNLRERKKADGYAKDAKQNEMKANENTKRANDKEREAKEQLVESQHNLGMMFNEKAKISLDKKEFNEARLYSLYALSILKKDGGEKERRNTINQIFNNPDYPLIFSSPKSGHHDSSITSIAYAPDGKTLASGSADNTIKLWNVATGKLIANFNGHSGRINSISWSPDGKTLASGSADNTIKLWNIATGKQITNFNGHSSVSVLISPNQISTVVWSPDGKMLASSSSDSTIKLWNITTGKQIDYFKGNTRINLFFPNQISKIAWSPDGNTLAIGAIDNTIKLSDISTSKQIAILVGHSDLINSLAWSPDGKTLASGAKDNTLKLWNVANNKQIANFKSHTAWINCVVWSPDGTKLASGSTDKTIKIWDFATGKQIANFKGHSDLINSITWSPDGKTLASAANDNTIKLWDIVTNKQITNFIGHSKLINSA